MAQNYKISSDADASTPYIDPNAKPPKKKLSKGRLAFFIILGLVVLLASATIITIAADVGGLRTKVIEGGDSVESDPELVAKEKQLNELQEKLDEEKAENKKEAERLAQLNEQLGIRENNLNQQEQDRIPLYRRLTGKDEEDMISISKTYSLMEPAKAAELLVALDSVENASAILYYMKEKSSAAILAVMNKDMAVKITDYLLYN